MVVHNILIIMRSNSSYSQKISKGLNVAFWFQSSTQSIRVNYYWKVMANKYFSFSQEIYIWIAIFPLNKTYFKMISGSSWTRPKTWNTHTQKSKFNSNYLKDQKMYNSITKLCIRFHYNDQNNTVPNKLYKTFTWNAFHEFIIFQIPLQVSNAVSFVGSNSNFSTAFVSLSTISRIIKLKGNKDRKDA